MKNNIRSAKKFIYLAIIIILAILTGFFRDTVFKSINELLRSWDLGQDYFLPNFLSFLEHYEYDTLLNIKLLLTLLFSIIYLILSLFAVFITSNNVKHLKITAFTYAGLIVISGVFIAIGYFFENTSEKMYEFARYLMGIAQSPIVVMILITAFKLSEKENSKTSNT